MSILGESRQHWNSLRMARDVIEGGTENVFTHPWWDTPNIRFTAFSDDPWPPPEEWPPYDSIWTTIGIGSVTPDEIKETQNGSGNR